MVLITVLHYINSTRTQITTSTTHLTNSPEKQNRDRTKILREESPDVFNLLPEHFLSEYKSFCWNNKNDKLLCLPSVYIAGMPKCGSTDLYNKLIWHQNLVRPTVGKENHYWARSRLGKNTYHLDRTTTPRKQFPAFLQSLGPEKIAEQPDLRMVDGTQSMLYDLLGWETRYPEYDEPPYSNADLLYEVSPGAKILVITRDPVQRLYSDYLYFVTETNPNVTAASFHGAVTQEMNRFRKCLETRDLRSCCYDSENDPKLRLSLGIYICFIRDWKEVFGSNMLVISLEDYSRYPIPTLSRLFSFLEVSQPDNNKLRTFLQSSRKSNIRPRNAASKGDMLPETKKTLQEFYGPYNSALAKYLEDTRFLYKYD